MMPHGYTTDEKIIRAVKIGVPKILLTWAVGLCGLLIVLLFFLGCSEKTAKPKAFFSTTSPAGTYTVSLTGQKERPLFFMVEARFEVSKGGEPFVTNKHLYSFDSMDLSFELGYPNHRWLSESTVQFYREEYFNDGEPDTFLLVNNTGRAIKYALVESEDKFLLFDLPAESTTKLLNSPQRGDFKWLNIAGEFGDGRSIVSKPVDLAIPTTRRGGATYNISINADGTILFEPRNEN
jgi:hypothetical protein